MAFHTQTTAGLALALVVGPGFAIGNGAATSGWHQFRGPSRDGKSAEIGLQRSWEVSGPREVWRVPIGAGFSAISIVGERLYAMDSDTENEYALALDAGSGRLLWRVPVGTLFKDGNGDGPRSTPTVDGNLVFVLGSRGRLMALQAANGKVVWQTELTQAFGSQLPTWGFSTSPLVEGDVLLAEVGGTGARAVAAFAKRSGELRWTSQQAGLAYSSPIRLDFGGVRQFVFLLQEKLVALDSAGREVWSVPFAAKLDIKPVSPVFVEPDLIFVSASYGVGAKVVRLKAEGGAVRAEEVWYGRQMRNHFNSSVALAGHVYGFDTETLRCVDARTGESRWAKRGLGKGSLIFADGMLIVLGERGNLVLLEATPDAYRELAAHQVLEGRCWTPPSLWQGRLYLRNRAEMVCLDLRG